jgi:hypothetical protein
LLPVGGDAYAVLNDVNLDIVAANVSRTLVAGGVAKNYLSAKLTTIPGFTSGIFYFPVHRIWLSDRAFDQ